MYIYIYIYVYVYTYISPKESGQLRHPSSSPGLPPSSSTITGLLALRGDSNQGCGPGHFQAVASRIRNATPCKRHSLTPHDRCFQPNTGINLFSASIQSRHQSNSGINPIPASIQSRHESNSGIDSISASIQFRHPKKSCIKLILAFHRVLRCCAANVCKTG